MSSWHAADWQRFFQAVVLWSQGHPVLTVGIVCLLAGLILGALLF